MPQSHVLSALTDKRAEVAGLIADLEHRLRQARADLSHIDATLVLFDPDARPASIQPRGPARPRTGYFANGEISRRCLDAIRVAEGGAVSADDIVRQAMADKGLDPEDIRTRLDLSQRFVWALARMQKKGALRRIGRGDESRWTAAAPCRAEG